MQYELAPPLVYATLAVLVAAAAVAFTALI